MHQDQESSAHTLQENGRAHKHDEDVKESGLLDVKPVDTRSASPSQKRPYRIPVPNRKGRRKDDSLLAVLCQWVVDHQIGQYRPVN